MINLRISIILIAFLGFIMSCHNVKVKNNADRILFLNKEIKIELVKDEFILTKNIIGYNLTIVNDKKLQILKKMEKPNIEIIFNNTHFIVKGNNLFNSGIPNGSDYFYPTNEEFKIIFFKKNVISISRG